MYENVVQVSDELEFRFMPAFVKVLNSYIKLKVYRTNAN